MGIKKMSRIIFAFILGACAVIASPVQASIVDFTASLDCAQANAGAGTCGAGGTGSGTGLMSLDTATNLFSWEVSWSGLSSDIVAGHIHGPADPDENAVIQFGLGVANNPAIGSLNISPSQVSDLLAGLWYINLHTQDFLAGEIRGQVSAVPVPAAVWLFGTGMIALFRISKRRSGSQI
jgi:hypothetical protein